MWPFRNRRKARPSLPVQLRARYDAAQTTVENARHWAMADGLSPDAAMTPDVRRTLRNRARYEESRRWGCKHPGGSRWKKAGM